MVVRLVALRVQTDRQAELAAVLAESYPRVRAVSGCQGIQILQDVTDSLRYVSWSLWDTVEALEAYRAGPVYAEVWPRIRACLAERAQAQTLEVRIPENQT